MPTFNQLVRKGRQTSEKKSTAPALQKGYNSLKKRATDVSAPQKRGVCTRQVLNSSSADHNNAMLLKVVSFTRNVACYFDSVRETNSGDFSQS